MQQICNSRATEMKEEEEELQQKILYIIMKWLHVRIIRQYTCNYSNDNVESENKLEKTLQKRRQLW